MSNDKIVIYQAWSTVAEGPVFLFIRILELYYFVLSKHFKPVV